MYLSIRKKLTMIYVILIIIPLMLLNFLSVSNVVSTVFHEMEVNALKTANIISNLSRDNFEDLVTLKRIVKQYGPTTDGRLLILDKKKEVLVDSFNLMSGEVVDNEEVAGALINQEKIGYYQMDNRIMQVAVPIATNIGGNRQVLGAVMISTDVEDSFIQVEEFQRQLLAISIIALLIGILVAILASNHISKPIVILTEAAKSIGEGRLGKQVSISSRDEIGRLAESFNNMSSQLYRIDKGRTQFIGDISHELKTPLASMKALIDSLLYGEDDIVVYKEYLKDMDMEIDRLTELIKALLNLNKLEELGIEAKEHPLKGLVLESIRILKPLVEKYNIDLTIDLDEDIMVSCDVDRIREVFINLIDNAIKYRDTSKTKNWVRIYEKRDKEHYYLIIEDNGIGIAKEDAESVFEKFYRSDFSRSRDTGGAGIGLSIVNRIIKLHKWSIRLDSQLGIGTSFIIEIPKGYFKVSS